MKEKTKQVVFKVLIMGFLIGWFAGIIIGWSFIAVNAQTKIDNKKFEENKLKLIEKKEEKRNEIKNILMKIQNHEKNNF